jgi:CheY-like chemotaxis protein
MQNSVVLVVDDDADVRSLAADILRDVGCVVISAAGGCEALKILAKVQVDAILTDVVMPGMNGLQFAKRARELMPTVGIMCMTGYSWGIAEGREHCDVFIQKPWHVNALVLEMGRLLGL